MDQIIKKISNWRRKTAFYRSLNILLFMMVKIFVPVFAAVIAANLSLSVAGSPFISMKAMVWLSIATTVLSGFDTFFNPGDKKRMSFLIYNKLTHLEDKLRVKLSELPNSVSNAKIVEEASLELKEILDEYAQKGWGS